MRTVSESCPLFGRHQSGSKQPDSPFVANEEVSLVAKIETLPESIFSSCTSPLPKWKVAFGIFYSLTSETKIKMLSSSFSRCDLQDDLTFGKVSSSIIETNDTA